MQKPYHRRKSRDNSAANVLLGKTKMSGILGSKTVRWLVSVLILSAFTCTPAAADRIKRTFFHKDVKSGVNTYIYKNEELHQDCTISHIKAKVSTYPEHGTLEMSNGTVANTYNKFLLQSKCARTVANGIKAFYRSSAGYKGKDEAVFHAIDSAGNQSYTTIYLTVR